MSIAACEPPMPVASSRTRFVVVDDHPLFVEAVVARLRRQYPRAQVNYAGPGVHEAVNIALTLGCDCAVVDLDLGPSMHSVEIVSAFTKHGIPMVVLTERATPQGLEASFVAGARAYVAKQSSPEVFGRAIAAVVDGGTWVPADVIRDSVQTTSVALSAQEQRALVFYASGMTQDSVARRMNIAPSTVKHYLDRVRAKYAAAGYPSRTKLELHELARHEGLLP